MPTNVVNIGEVIIHGIVFDPKNSEALRTMDLDGLLKSIPRLFELLEERDIDYVLVGGIAMLIRDFGTNMAPLFEELATHLAESDVRELRNIVREIEDRIARSRQRFGDIQQ
jgi:hypothetical protein